MLGPAPLSVSQLKTALKPAAGYEQQLWASTQPYTEPGVISITGPNSGVFNANVADTAQLLAAPQEIVAVLDGEVNSAANIVVTVTGTDQFGQAFSGTGTFRAPGSVNFQECMLPRGYAVDIAGLAGQQVKTITAVGFTCNGDVAPLAIKLIGLPSFSANQAQTGAYRMISAKTKLDYSMGVPDPHPVQIGRDMSNVIKPGEIPVKKIDITQKVGSMGDGLMRINGNRLTGLVREIKEDKVETMRCFFPGMIITAEPSTGQSVEDVEATGKGMAERVVLMLAL